MQNSRNRGYSEKILKENPWVTGSHTLVDNMQLMPVHKKLHRYPSALIKVYNKPELNRRHAVL